MLLSVVGSPNTGKSTFFSAITLSDVEISPRPFTTIKPNFGVTYVRFPCPCKELGLKCNPKNSICKDGIRFVPINIIDVAGLVPGAHLGKGLGNKFLDDIRATDILIQVVDVSGKIDAEGNPTEFYDPANEVIFLDDEISQWISGILKKAQSKIKGKGIEGIEEVFTGLKIKKDQIIKAAKKVNLDIENVGKIEWKDEDRLEFSKEIRKIAMPIIIAANKIDLPGARENYEKLKKKFPEKVIIPTYSDGELALRRANEKKIINYTPGDFGFEIINASERQKEALEKIKRVMKENEDFGTGVQKVLEEAVRKLKLIVVYPVSDENKFTDHFGKVLPDAILVKEGTTAIQLAEKIHTDLAKNFIFAIDAKKKLRIGRDHILKNGDIIKIVSGK